MAYTEETYIVIYHPQWQRVGDYPRIVVRGNSDISLIDVPYGVDLTDLEVGETYVYEIVSNNTVGLTTQSVAKTFDAGMFKVDRSPLLLSYLLAIVVMSSLSIIQASRRVCSS